MICKNCEKIIIASSWEVVVRRLTVLVNDENVVKIDARRVDLFVFVHFSDVFTETDIVANAFFLFAAGFQTVSNTLSFCLYELALRKDYQDRVRDEIRTKRAEHGGTIDNDKLSSLVFMDQVLSG